MNPCKPVPFLYDAEILKQYDTSYNNLTPHVYAIGIRVQTIFAIFQIIRCSSFRYLGSEAMKKLRSTKCSQSIVVTGLSGSGKTETTKHLIQFLCNKGALNVVKDRIWQSNPILELFGNAETSENLNSSRFSKIIDVSFV